jgi:hypothetical protein
MVTKKDLIIAVLATFCLTVTIFMIMPIKSANNAYDPSADINHDGKVSLADLVALANSYGYAGDPTLNVTVTNAIPGITVPYWYIYSAPFIVSFEALRLHPSSEGVGPGVYETDILVHNPSGPFGPYPILMISKKIVVAFEEGKGYQAPIWLQPEPLNYDQAFRIDSQEIWNAIPGNLRSNFNVTKGYVGIISTSPNLDVNAYYTVSELLVTGTPPEQSMLPGNTTSIDSQIISHEPYEPIWFNNFTAPP